MTTAQTTPRSADALYQTRLAEVRGLIAELESVLDEHARAQAQRPRDWGFAGDLGRMKELLNDLLEGHREE